MKKLKSTNALSYNAAIELDDRIDLLDSAYHFHTTWAALLHACASYIIDPSISFDLRLRCMQREILYQGTRHERLGGFVDLVDRYGIEDDDDAMRILHVAIKNRGTHAVFTHDHSISKYVQSSTAYRRDCMKYLAFNEAIPDAVYFELLAILNGDWNYNPDKETFPVLRYNICEDFNTYRDLLLSRVESSKALTDTLFAYFKTLISCKSLEETCKKLYIEVSTKGINHCIKNNSRIAKALLKTPEISNEEYYMLLALLDFRFVRTIKIPSKESDYLEVEEEI